MMRRWLFALTTAVLAWHMPVHVALAADAGATLLPVKSLAPPAAEDKRLADILARHQGKPVLLNFWATWCEPCREEMPSLERLAARWRAKGLLVQTVAVADNPNLVKDFLGEVLPEGHTLPVLHDREQATSRAWQVRMLPTTVILDHGHRIVLRGRGAIDWDAPDIEEQLRTTLKQTRR
jgi:thiol-disulfide isomerase/thioredoxin